MPVIPYCTARACCSSTSTLPMRMRPSYSSANSSRMGASILHGPHQAAVKSTRKGLGDFRTSCSKFSWVKVTMPGADIT